MHVLKYLRACAVLSACYLINRMHSSVFHGKIPFSCFYYNKSVFSVAPRVFGCICFIQDLSPSLDKLSSRSIVSLLGILELRKDTCTIIFPTRSILRL